MAEEAGIIEMRPDERLDRAALESFLADRLPGAEGPLGLRQFSTGAANLTYLLDYDEASYVLRRPPLGPVAPGAHDMAREYRVLSNLHAAYPLAPRVYLFDEGREVVGAPFFVMERRPGFAITKDLPAEIATDDDRKTSLAWMMIDHLAALHAVDPGQVGLATLGRPEGFARRQLEGWARRWAAAEGDAYAGASEILAALAAAPPAPLRTALLHNDFKLNNILVSAEDPCRATAVVDWDMCTRGDPLFDLGWLLVYWTEAEDDPLWRAAASMPFGDGGFPSRAEAVARYAERTGLAVDRIGWYHAFGIFKAMVILQQIFIRYERGQTADRRFAIFGDRVRGLVDKALGILAQAQ